MDFHCPTLNLARHGSNPNSYDHYLQSYVFVAKIQLFAQWYGIDLLDVGLWIVELESQ